MSVLRPPFIEIDAAPRPSGAGRVTALREIPPVEMSPPAMTPAGENLCPRCNRSISPTASQTPGGGTSMCAAEVFGFGDRCLC